MPAKRSDVAALAKVSPAVVSFVLNGTRPVAPQTRGRVLDAIAELDYRPNAIARALKTSSTRSVGLLVPDFRNPFFLEMVRALEDAAYESGQVMLIRESRAGVDEEKHLETFFDRQVDGLILLAEPTWTALKDEINTRRMPVVLLDRAAPTDLVSTIISNEFESAIIGVEHLITSGHRNIACVAGLANTRGSNERVRGWRAAMAAAGLSAGDDMLVHSQPTEQGGDEAVVELLRRGNPIDALFVASDAQAVGALSRLYDAGIRVPDSLAVVAFDGTYASAFTAPPLTVVAQPFGLLAEAAIKQLDTQIQDPESAGVKIELSADLIVRRSAPLAPAPSS